MQRKFIYVPHTAEMKFIAYGKSERQAIENSALAMLNIMFDIEKIRRAKSVAKAVSIRSKAYSPADLVWHTLQKILTIVDEKELKPYSFKVFGIKSVGKVLALKGKLFYKSTDVECYRTEIKAVTPYALQVVYKKGVWRISVVVDV
ncbi:MAG: archease [Candidatus Micrarchaeia archaeon]